MIIENVLYYTDSENSLQDSPSAGDFDAKLQLSQLRIELDKQR